MAAPLSPAPDVNAACAPSSTDLPEGVQRVLAFLTQAGHPHTPILLDGAARTAQQAADALQVALGQIAKSIIFKSKVHDRAVLVVTAGDRRVDTAKVEALLGKVGRADADFVKAQTGFSIGGVSPFAHSHAPLCLIDESLARFDTIWAAAGHPHAVFPLNYAELLALSGAAAHDVTEAPAAAVPLATAPVASPCVSICEMDATTGWCKGCLRTLDEIANWSAMDDTHKRGVLEQCKRRIESGRNAFVGVGF